MKNTISTDLLIKAYMTPAEMISREILWENHQIEEGVAKYREAMLKKDLSDTTGGLKLIKNAMPNTIEAVEDAYTVSEGLVLGAPTKGRQDNWVYMISLLQAEQTALIALNKMFTHCQTPTDKMSQVTSLAKKIGEALNQQVKFENWKAESKIEAITEGKKKSHAQWLIQKAKGQVDRQRVARWEKKFENYRNIDWGQDVLNIGTKMIDIVCAANPDLFTLETTTVNRKTTRTISMTDTAWAQYEQTEDFAELQRPFLLPTLIQPKEWKYVDGKVQGGYHHIKSSLFTRGLFAHTSDDATASSQTFLDSVNAVQNTAWKINPYILMVVDMIYGTGSCKGGVTQNGTQITPSMDAESYDKMTKEDKKAYHEKRTIIVGEIASARGRHSAFTRKLSIAHKMAEHSEFFFPHFADFRGRLYPMPSELTPQGDSVAKSLLMFANGKKLGESGLKWLMITAANTFGMDKETLATREQWALDNLEMMARVSSDPLTNEDWNNADEPLIFLAAAKEITTAIATGNPAEFVSHLPNNQDGTCNGMQILSMLGKDQTGAAATNCTASDVRHDLYATVAASVMTILNRDSGDCAISAEWVSRLQGNFGAQRSTVKRAVMTVPYGVTENGIAEQLVNDRKCNDFVSASRDGAAKVMTSAILEAMTQVNGKAVEIMGYFKEVSGALATEGLPMTWYTPMGLKVTQAYNRTNKKEVKTILGDIILQVEDKDLGLDRAGQVRSIAPNVIHSLDAAMLQDTVLRMQELGYEDFSMIHDSYGVHAGGVEDLHGALRASALEIFSEDYLAEFHAHAQAQVSVALPSPPMQGDYDINEITNAPYFFS